MEAPLGRRTLKFAPVDEKSLVPYRQCSAGKVWLAEDFGASIVDTAICAKPGEVLAGQLLYGDSIPRSYFVLT
jgi:hypothetical protein